jgi:hypothetical protein
MAADITRQRWISGSQNRVISHKPELLKAASASQEVKEWSMTAPAVRSLAH